MPGKVVQRFSESTATKQKERGKNAHYDVIVMGGGPSGVSAALTAARRGAHTLLVERYGYCGGMSTAALVNPWCGHEYTDPATGRNGSIIGGVFREVALNLYGKGGFGSTLSPAAFDEELLKREYDALLTEAGVQMRYHTYLQAVEMKGNRIDSVVLHSKSGPQVCSADNYVDCTGDGDLAALAGVPFSVGRSSDGLTQAMTVCFRMANVDKREMVATGNLRAARALVEPYFQAALASGALHYPHRNFIHFYDYPRPGILHFNMTRITQVSGLSVEDLTKSEVEGRRQAYVMGDWLMENVPYFQNAYVEKVACQVGVRETRHIHGLYTMGRDDIQRASKFADGITRSRYFIDIHNPTGAKDPQQKVGRRGAVKQDYGPQPGAYYEVPFRSLVTDACPNLVVACRALSATHEASAAVRVMATMHGVGEAAGVAVAEAARRGDDVTGIPGEWVRAQIPYMDEGPDYREPWAAPAGYPWSEDAEASFGNQEKKGTEE